MDLSGLNTLRLDASFSVLGVAARVTRPPADDTPIVTIGIWTASVEDGQPFGTDAERTQPRQVLSLRRDVLPTLPRGSIVVAPEKPGAADKTWRVDGFERPRDPFCWYAVVKQVT